MTEQGVPAGDIGPVLDKIDELTETPDPGASAALHDQALLALMELEYRLRQQVENSDVPELLLSESAEVSEEYADMVADYFRRLSQP